MSDDECSAITMIASQSENDRRYIEQHLHQGGVESVRVSSAREAERALNGSDAGVLVIDSGLLEAGHDGQWRELRSKRPELGTVVLALFDHQRGKPLVRASDGANVVDPGDAAGIVGAVQDLHRAAAG